MIFYDRGYRAQDNAEHLCRWVMKNHPEVETGYILNKTSYDWDRLQKEGFNLINALDKGKTYNELLRCDYACSSIFNETIKLNFDRCHCKRIFLNHGCFLAPMSYIKAEAKNVDLFIATNQAEYNTFLHPYHGLTEDQVALCGQARQDSLIKQQQSPHVEDSILIQFWQRPGEWTENNNKLFLESDFYKKTTALLSNQKLLDVCKKHNLKLVFKMHSIQYNWLNYYKKYASDIIRISGLDELFEPEFIRSKLMITDISSNAYEMATIGKPCIYFEPDPEVLFTWRKRRNGPFEFDLEHNSIGPIINKSVEALVNEICKLIETDFKLDQVYSDRVQQQVLFMNNPNNCKRCFEAILNVKRSRTSEKTAGKQTYIGRANTFLYF